MCADEVAMVVCRLRQLVKLSWLSLRRVGVIAKRDRDVRHDDDGDMHKLPVDSKNVHNQREINSIESE